MATISHTQWWLVSPKSAVTTKGRFGFSVSLSYDTRLASRLVWSAAAYFYSQLTYTCAYTSTHMYIFMHTRIYKSIGPLAIRHLPTRHTVGNNNKTQMIMLSREKNLTP